MLHCLPALPWPEYAAPVGDPAASQIRVWSCLLASTIRLSIRLLVLPAPPRRTSASPFIERKNEHLPFRLPTQPPFPATDTLARMLTFCCQVPTDPSPFIDIRPPLGVLSGFDALLPDYHPHPLPYGRRPLLPHSPSLR